MRPRRARRGRAARARSRSPPGRRRRRSRACRLRGRRGSARRRMRVGLLRARVVEALVHARALLRVGRGGVDRHHHRAGRRIGLLAGVDHAGVEGELVLSSIIGRAPRKWLSRSMRVIEPEELVAVDDDRHEAAVEHRQQLGDGCVGRDRLEPRRPSPSPTGVAETLAMARRRRRALEQVALVDDADDAVALEHRQLRDVGGAHAVRRR